MLCPRSPVTIAGVFGPYQGSCSDTVPRGFHRVAKYVFEPGGCVTNSYLLLVLLLLLWLLPAQTKIQNKKHNQRDDNVNLNQLHRYHTKQASKMPSANKHVMRTLLPAALPLANKSRTRLCCRTRQVQRTFCLQSALPKGLPICPHLHRQGHSIQQKRLSE